MSLFDRMVESAPGPGLGRLKANTALAKKHGGVAAAAGIYSFPKRGNADAFIDELRKRYPGLPTRAETKRIAGQLRFIVRFDEFKEDAGPAGDELLEVAGKGKWKWAIPELVKTWKVRAKGPTGKPGVVVQFNASAFRLGDSADAIAFELKRAAKTVHREGSR